MRLTKNCHPSRARDLGVCPQLRHTRCRHGPRSLAALGM